MNLKEFRAQYPQYDDLSDDQLATGLHQRFYSDLPKEDFFKQIGYTAQAATTSNPLKGALGRGADLLASGIEAVKRSTQELGKRMEGALTEEEKAGMADLRSKVPSVVKPEDEKKIFGTLEDWTNSLRGYSKSIGYEPSVKLGDLGDNPLKVVPFVAERIITSSPDMAAAVANAPAYVYARTDEILNERLKNDQKDLKDATVGDLTTALGAAIFETTLERFATRGLLKGQGAPGKTAAGRIGKETAIQSGTEGVEEGVAYIAGTAGTKKGVDYKELAENVAEGMIVGGGLGTSVQTGKEILKPKEKAAEEPTVRQEFTTDAQGNLVPKTPAAPATTPAPVTGAAQPELFTEEQAPYAVTQGETTAEQRQQAEVERQIDALLQEEQTPEVLAQIEQLKSQLPEAPKDRATALGEEMMTLERKYKELETTRNATKGLKEKGALTEQMKTIRARQTEILAEGKQLQKQGVSFAAPEEQAAFEFEVPAVIDDAVIKRFGFTPKATKIVEAVRDLDMTKPEDRQTFRNEIAKHERKGAKVDVQAAEDYVANFEEAPSGPRAIPGASQPSIPVPSEEVTPTGGLEAPVTGRLEPTVGPTGGPVGGAEISGEGGAAALGTAPVGITPTQTAAQTVPPTTVDQALQQAETPAQTSIPSEKPQAQREEVLGKKSEPLTKSVADGDTKSALQEIATSQQFSPLDNLLAQGLLDTNKTLPKIEVVAPAKIDEDAAGQYDPNIDTAQIAEGQVDSHTVLHEVSHGSMHAMIVADENQVAKGLPANPVLNDIKDVYQHVLRVRKDLVASGKYGIKNLTEFVSEMWSNPEFQLEMKNTPYKRITVYKEFGRKVVKLLTGIDLEAGKVSAVDADALVAGLLAIEKAMPLGRRVQEAGKVQAPVAAVQRTPQGQKNEQLFKAAGGGKFPPPQPKFKRKLQEWKTAYNNNMLIPTLLGKGQNLFSFDRAYSNRMRNALFNLAKQGNITMQQAKLALLRTSISQALYRSDIARRFMSSGKIGYNAAENRWYTEKDPINMEALKDEVRAYAKRTGADNDQALQEIGQAYIAYRMEGFYKDLDNTKAEVTRTEKKIQAKIDVDKNKKLLKDLKKKEQSLIDKVKGVTRQEMQAGMQLYNSNPEIKKGTDIWNTMRERAIKALVESGVKNEEQAQDWLDEAAYVPFFRNMGENEQSGPLVMTRGLREVMGDPRMKGSDKEITNPIENMHQWMQWSIARAISNKQLNVMLAQYKAVLPNEVKEGKGDPASTFSVYQDGKQKFYQVADPAIAQGFSGMETVIFPGIGAAMRFKNGFSHIITRIPIFPVAQLILMDTWAAMYTSGVKHPFALLKEIPKEMVKTAMGTSEARKVMTSAGVLSTHEYNALTDADDLTVKLQLDKPGVYARTMNMLDKWAALNDNMLRQAVYAQRKKEGASQAEAMEAGVEIVNFRRMSGNPIMRFASSITPFFNAATQVLDVAGKTVTGKGITPQERKEGLAVLAATAAKLTAISFVYAAAVSDDEDYQKKNRMVRDRVFVIPGSGGFSIPLREDIFLIPKIAGEYSYNLMMDKAFVDSKMAKDAMARAVKKQFSPPSTNLVSPILDVSQNYDSFHDRDIVNPTLSKLDPELQYTKSTSELSKVLGKAGGISPAKLDYALNGYFGSVMTLLALATNDMIAQARGVPRPERTTKEIVASLPSMGGFVSKQESVNAIGDFYEAARDVNKTVNTYRELSKRDRAEGDKYIKEPERTKQAEQYKGVQKIEDFLAKINREETRIMESKDMTSAEKRRELDKLLVERQKFTKPVRELRQNLGF